MSKLPGTTGPISSNPNLAGGTGKLISSYYLEIEYLLDRVERSSTHYQTLGLERSATGEDVIAAYQHIISMLHPSNRKIRSAVPDEMLTRIDATFKKVSACFGVLANADKRASYDRSLKRPACRPLPVDIPTTHKPPPEDYKAFPEEAVVEASKTGELINIAMPGRGGRIRIGAAGEVAERRRCERLKLCLPVLVTGQDRSGGKWKEVAKTVDASRMGVSVLMNRRVKMGTVVHLRMPLPVKLRTHGYAEAGYTVYAIVRRCDPPANGMRITGLEFVGEHPPAGYLQKPWAKFVSEKWTGPDRRLEARRERSESVVVQYVNDAMQVTGQENTTTENVSPSGARILSKAAPPELDLVKLICKECDFESLAAVRNRYKMKDGPERLCLQLIEKQWPV
jgi:hypothetical protein